jgi:peptidoglycan hydrolase FlgJ
MNPIRNGPRDSALGTRVQASPESRLPTPDEAKLRKTAQQLESLFVEQLYKAMRETVPQGEGVVAGGTGEDMFTSLMDQHLAADTPTQWAHGLASAAYRQLRRALPDADVPPANAPTTLPANAGATTL